MTRVTPSKVNGGCLCGSIRYVVNVSNDHDWDNCVSTYPAFRAAVNAGEKLWNAKPGFPNLGRNLPVFMVSKSNGFSTVSVSSIHKGRSRV
jgi:hypothetical protein